MSAKPHSDNDVDPNSLDARTASVSEDDLKMLEFEEENDTELQNQASIDPRLQQKFDL
jgi:hypothetical protein